MIQTFGFHLTSIDFRQTSEKNTEAVQVFWQRATVKPAADLPSQEYLKAMEYPDLPVISKLKEKDRQALLLDLLLYKPIEFNPWIIPQLSKTTRDTFETLLIFSDAARGIEISFSSLSLFWGFSFVCVDVVRSGPEYHWQVHHLHVPAHQRYSSSTSSLSFAALSLFVSIITFLQTF